MRLEMIIPGDTNLDDPGTATLTGTIQGFPNSGSDSMSEITGQRSRYVTNPAPGQYNIVIGPASDSGSDAPAGSGFGTATVSTSGAVAFTMQLADGISPPFSCASSLAADGSCPFYGYLYGGKGMLLGWLVFASEDGGLANSTTVLWTKPATGQGFYPDGFGANPSVTAAPYTVPKGTTNLFAGTEFYFSAGDNLTGTNVTIDFKPGPNKFTDRNNVAVTLNPKNGMLSGTFFLPGAHTATHFQAIMEGSLGLGYYSSGRETHPISLGADAVDSGPIFNYPPPPPGLGGEPSGSGSGSGSHGSPGGGE
ncbi:MAG TPA: hypothetical protein VHB20_08780 [Verrucomicrobiae bacterium]|jgi:hypothetical protein|nr:hypothetical protein [Verrucomicrobiae bacterium]